MKKATRIIPEWLWVGLVIEILNNRNDDRGFIKSF